VAYTKEFLFNSVDGRGIKLGASSSPGTILHEVSASPIKDEIWMWATNTDSVDRTITIQFGGTGSPEDNIKHIVPAGQQILVCPGLVLSNAVTVRAYGSSGNVLVVHGFVNRIS